MYVYTYFLKVLEMETLEKIPSEKGIVKKVRASPTLLYNLLQN